MKKENKECCEKCLMGSAIPDPWCNNKDCPCHLPSAPQEKSPARQIFERSVNMIADNLNLSSKVLYNPQESKDWEREFDGKFIPFDSEIDKKGRIRLESVAFPHIKAFIRTQKQLSYQEGCNAGYEADLRKQISKITAKGREAGRTEAFAEVEAKLNDFIFGAFDNKDEYWVTKDSVRKLFDWLQEKLK